MQAKKIRILSEEIICRIAAGEVVERPASVVKELIENAIDARADRIEVEIKDGGHKLIEVTDNGKGMCRQDAQLAFTSHATSKISDDSDIEQIVSLGFRGEALPTIASVSRVTMVTRHASEPTATRIQIDGGKIAGVDSDSFPQGTRIQVKNLFFNVPARRKFLKSVQAEMAQISDVVCHYMMGYPEIAFRFTKGNIQLAATSGSGNLIDAIVAVYGPELSRDLIELKEAPAERMGLSIRGYISPPTRARPAARYMTTMINRRFVRTRLLTQAISKAISAFFPRGRYPVLILDLRMSPAMLDVNVHPQKTEVRFKDERLIFAAVWETIQASLSGLRMISAPADAADQTSTNGSSPQTQFGRSSLPGTGQSGLFTPSMPAAMQQSSFSGSDRIYELKDHDTENLGPHSAPSRSAPLEPVSSLTRPKILAQLKSSYLLGEDDTGLFIIDQHAAHERILFDQFMQSYDEVPIAAQPLLFPVPLNLLPSEKMVVKEHFDELKELGFTFQLEEDGQVYVTAVPVNESSSSKEESIQEVLSQVLNGYESRTQEEVRADVFKMMACKGAVKAGDCLNETEWTSLLEQLLKTENPFTCPHGRPVVIRLTTRQIETGFMRT